VAEWWAPLLHIPKFLISDPVPETGYPDQGRSWVFHGLSYQDSTSN
jgi:hypothetical protein